MPDASIDIITPLWRAEYLEELYESIKSQAVNWKWLIQIDKKGIAVPSDIKMDERVSISLNPQSYGTALSRNRALMRSKGDFIFAVDDDDIICENALKNLSIALYKYPKAFGAWGETYTFNEKEKNLFKDFEKEGLLETGTISNTFEETGELIIHCGSLLWRRKHLLALGGWAGLWHSEDTNLVLAADSLFSSVYISNPVYHYRRGSISQESSTNQFEGEKPIRHAYSKERVKALKELLRPNL